jgi:hypothetical protein
MPQGASSMTCNVCASQCDVARSVQAHGSLGSYMAGRTSPHDFFSCPLIGRAWHTSLTHALVRIEDDDFGAKALAPLLLEISTRAGRMLALITVRGPRQAGV